jgi:hypothetical protein
MRWDETFTILSDETSYDSYLKSQRAREEGKNFYHRDFQMCVYSDVLQYDLRWAINVEVFINKA